MGKNRYDIALGKNEKKKVSITITCNTDKEFREKIAFLTSQIRVEETNQPHGFSSSDYSCYVTTVKE